MELLLKHPFLRRIKIHKVPALYIKIINKKLYGYGSETTVLLAEK